MSVTLVAAMGGVIWSSLPRERKVGRLVPAPDRPTSN